MRSWEPELSPVTENVLEGSSDRTQGVLKSPRAPSSSAITAAEHQDHPSSDFMETEVPATTPSTPATPPAAPDSAHLPLVASTPSMAECFDDEREMQPRRMCDLDDEWGREPPPEAPACMQALDAAFAHAAVQGGAWEREPLSEAPTRRNTTCTDESTDEGTDEERQPCDQYDADEGDHEATDEECISASEGDCSSAEPTDGCREGHVVACMHASNTAAGDGVHHAATPSPPPPPTAAQANEKEATAATRMRLAHERARRRVREKISVLDDKPPRVPPPPSRTPPRVLPASRIERLAQQHSAMLSATELHGALLERRGERPPRPRSSPPAAVAAAKATAKAYGTAGGGTWTAPATRPPTSAHNGAWTSPTRADQVDAERRVREAHERALRRAGGRAAVAPPGGASRGAALSSLTSSDWGEVAASAWAASVARR